MGSGMKARLIANALENGLFRVECGWPGVERGLRVEVEVPGDERTSTPAIFKGPRAVSHPTCCCSASLDRCDRCDLLVGLEGFHLMSVARTPDALMLDIESCDRCAGCPGCGLNRSRPRACGGGGDRRTLGRGPGKVAVV